MPNRTQTQKRLDKTADSQRRQQQQRTLVTPENSLNRLTFDAQGRLTFDAQGQLVLSANTP